MFDTHKVSTTGEILLRMFAARDGSFFFFAKPNRNTTVSIPLKKHKGCVEFRSVVKTTLCGWVKRAKGEVEEKDMGLRKSVLRSTNLTTL